MVSFKQKRILEIAEAKGRISMQEVEQLYPLKPQRINSMSSLEVQGLLIKEQFGWKYAK